jgi:hypothetical protein
MMKSRIFIFLFLSSMIGFLSGCLKPESYPDIPEIELENFIRVYDTRQYPVRGILIFSFRDGNGDIGLLANDTFPPYNKNGDYYYNLVISYFEKQNGIYQKIDLDPPLSGRIPILNPDDPGKAIKGMIADTMPLNPHPLFDTVRIEVFIYDRALNKSNVITTPDIILKRP